MLRTLLAASFAATAAFASANAGEGDFNLGVGYSHIDIDPASFNAITLRGGYEFTDYLGVEGQIDFGIDDDSIMVANVPVSVELNHAASLFGIARMPLSERTSLFARLGYTTAEVEAGAANISIANDTDGFAYGVGGEFFLDDRNGFRADYTRYDFDGSGEADVFGISFVRRFGGN